MITMHSRVFMNHNVEVESRYHHSGQVKKITSLRANKSASAE